MNQCDTAVSATPSEAERLAHLALLQVVDTDAEPFFDALAAAAQASAGPPIAVDAVTALDHALEALRNP
ncbi:hypothetical protein BRM22_23635 [Xanthomonas oryzae pv. oryzae]|uniref:Uncharacterized protein n=2 Tax=Xanthomonas oryzae pv. oryzae TaxID=64187 RepID=Q05HP8_XANOR|nr:hypothetical protein XOO4955 [Xanthomonas oryzae pv. oryzae KACC 10331]ALZ73877.1 hypothetical protein APZ20_22845 [Xanthomonas oryzae pv. oryzae]AOS04805.1 hypothetical protein ATY42_22530 [Xanthomonas oryzae pv. oryzae]AOS08500.1 hypothetical protein ATY43_23815 [Xanthomonas oryzae pv. oryzae]AOS12685.1 hypothetical protein ATY44_23020 [Xanthomonas oryzae pv. oryzae]